MMQDIRDCVAIIAAAVTLCFVAFNIRTCNIQTAELQAKYPHNYEEQHTYQNQTGPAR